MCSTGPLVWEINAIWHLTDGQHAFRCTPIYKISKKMQCTSYFQSAFYFTHFSENQSACRKDDKVFHLCRNVYRPWVQFSKTQHKLQTLANFRIASFHSQLLDFKCWYFLYVTVCLPPRHLVYIFSRCRLLLKRFPRVSFCNHPSTPPKSLCLPLHLSTARQSVASISRGLAFESLPFLESKSIRPEMPCDRNGPALLYSTLNAAIGLV